MRCFRTKWEKMMTTIEINKKNYDSPKTNKLQDTSLKHEDTGLNKNDVKRNYLMIFSDDLMANNTQESNFENLLREMHQFRNQAYTSSFKFFLSSFPAYV